MTSWATLDLCICRISFFYVAFYSPVVVTDNFRMEQDKKEYNVVTAMWRQDES